jgi:hypothetical protein
MTRQVLLVFFSIALSFCHAQEIERKVKYSKNGDKETFYVLKSDNNVLHGSYEKKGAFSHVTGTYKNGLKDGLWTEFSTKSKLRSRGAYANNVRVGIWKFYNWEGELEQEFNFTTNELVSDNLLEVLKERKFKIIKGTDTLFTFLERPPVYITGKTRMQSALTKGSQIGIILRLTQASGNVIVGFVIDTTGKARDYRIISGIHPACDTEALRMVKQIPPNWLPAKLNGELVEVEHSITISFKNNL